MDKCFIQLAIAIVATVLIGGLALTPTYAKATNIQIPIDTEGLTSCGTETVKITGTLHFVAQLITTSSGNFIDASHVNFQSVKGVGLTSGEDYVFSNNQNNHEKFSATSADEFMANLHAVGVKKGGGSSDNFGINILIHLTASSNGDITANKDDTRLRCDL